MVVKLNSLCIECRATTQSNGGGMRYYQPANNAPDQPGAGMLADSASVCSNNAMNGACCWGYFALMLKCIAFHVYKTPGYAPQLVHSLIEEHVIFVCNHAAKRSSPLQAAWLALMYADMPGVSPVRAAMARCLAKQNVDWILGANDVSVGDVQGFSFQVGFNGTSCGSACS